VAPCGPWRCRGAKEALGVIQWLCSDTLSVKLYRLGPASTRCMFWRLLCGKGDQLEGLTRGPRSHRAPKASRGVCLLASCPMRDPVGGAVDRAVPAGQHWGGPKALVACGTPFCSQAMASTEGQEGAKDQV
jgi:hypothetical protein